MSAAPIRWGILGPGRIAHRFAQALEVVDGARLQAVASRSAERAGEFAREYGAPAAYGSDEALAADPNVDAVYIATPHRFHHAQARLCLEAGKPVLCEKPLTVNAAEAEDLIRLARAKRVFLMEALWSRCLPVYRQVRTWLDAGAIGDIRLVSSTFCFQPERDPADRKFNHDLAGGGLLDLGVYNVALSQWAIGADPIAISAKGQIGDTGVDEMTAATMVYPGDVMAQFTCSLLFDAANDLTIYGTRGFVRLHPDFWGSTQATLAAGGSKVLADHPFRRNGFEYEVEEAMDCIRRGRIESADMPLAATLANLRAMDEIRAQIGLRYSFE
jgi:predicted dehydrogenase